MLFTDCVQIHDYLNVELYQEIMEKMKPEKIMERFTPGKYRLSFFHEDHKRIGKKD